MTRPDTAEWWDRLSELATNGPADDEIDDARAFIEEAERMTNLARELLRPRAVSPSHARLLVYPLSDAKHAKAQS